ncbi:hypothetical protein GCM10023168_28880 [Fodinibacter luteus]|uniref:Uncharacterized protein n=1 Tax=Fodinibacter luteus TaxID=552064 RepID=A0ABP8KL35_9MICO
MKSRTAADPAPVTWSPMAGTGTTADPLVLSCPNYEESVEELLAALRAVNAQPCSTG